MTRLDELKIKRKAALIGVCTLGLAGLVYVGVGNTWRGNIFQGTSLSQNAGVGFVFKIVSFMFLSVLLAIPFFIISLIQLIYYQIEINKETERYRLRQQYQNQPMGRQNNVQQQVNQINIFDVNYYYREENQLYGPLSLEELTYLDIHSNTLLGINNTNNWKRAGDLPNLLETLQYVKNE